MTPDQFRRATELGVTCSLFVDHLYYWGDVLVDDLFGPERGARWAAAGSAIKAGQRISFHNDGPVTPTNPLRNIADAVTRRTRSGRVLAPEERISVPDVRAETINSAWHLRSEDAIGGDRPRYARRSRRVVGQPASGGSRRHRGSRGARHDPGGSDGLRKAGVIRVAPGSRALRSIGTSAGNWIRTSGYTRKWLVLGVVIGIVAGLGAVVFYVALSEATQLLIVGIGGLPPADRGG